MEDEFVKQTVKSCRLFTEPAESIKYYGEERREFWNSDSDEVMLLVQFFNNCIVSGDPESVEIAKEGFEKLAEKDDDALHDVISSVLLRHLGTDELEALFDPDNQPEFRRYNLALAAKIHPELLTADRKERLYNSQKARVKAFIKNGQQESREAYEEALILGEFGDNRAIPLLRRFAASIKESSAANFWAICSEIESLGGDAQDLKTGNVMY